MDPRDLKAYVARRWAAVEALKQEHWAREFAERGPEVTLAASWALWRHARSLDAEWPSDQQRREDLAHHIALKRAIDGAASAFISIARR